MPNLRGGGPGSQNRDIHLTFLGLRLQRGYQVPPRDVTTGCYVTITKPCCAQQLLYSGKFSIVQILQKCLQTLWAKFLWFYFHGMTVWRSDHSWLPRPKCKPEETTTKQRSTVVFVCVEAVTLLKYLDCCHWQRNWLVEVSTADPNLDNLAASLTASLAIWHPV